MNTFTSKDLEVIQAALNSHMKYQLDQPDCNYGAVKDLLTLTEKIDDDRRIKWHEEHFNDGFTVSDIPF